MFELSKEKQQYAGLFQEVLAFLFRIVTEDGSSKLLEQFKTIEQLCMRLIHTQAASPLRLVHNVDRPILDTLLDDFPVDNPRKIEIVSPFYDNRLTPLARLQERFPMTPVHIYVQQGKSNFPTALLNDKLIVWRYDGSDRYLHGKAIHFDCGTTSYLLTGSANFTAPALCRTAQAGNYEVGLFGEVEGKVARALVRPDELTVTRVRSADQLVVSKREEPKRAESAWRVEYLVEAVREKKHLRLMTRDGGDFRPKLVRISTPHGLSDEQPYAATVPMPPSLRKQHPLSVELIGHNQQGEQRVSNVVWVVDLVEARGDKMRQRERRIFSDPAELYEVLREIVETGDEQELLLFLKRFDIPLDMLFAARARQLSMERATMGNVMGGISKHAGSEAYDNALAGFDDCLYRLYRKLEKHAAAPNADHLNNFLTIYYSMLTLLSFVSDWAASRFENERTISGQQWLFIRNCYDRLIGHDHKSWQLIWQSVGYRDQINAQLAERAANEDDGQLDSYESQLQAWVGGAESVQAFLLRPINVFQQLHEQVVMQKSRKKPKIFPTNHFNLHEERLEKILVDFAVQ